MKSLKITLAILMLSLSATAEYSELILLENECFGSVSDLECQTYSNASLSGHIKSKVTCQFVVDVLDLKKSTSRNVNVQTNKSDYDGNSDETTFNIVPFVGPAITAAIVNTERIIIDERLEKKSIDMAEDRLQIINEHRCTGFPKEINFFKVQ